MASRKPAGPPRRRQSSGEQIEGLRALHGRGEHRSDSRIDQLRIPPQSIEAEQAVLGGMMLAPDALAIVRTVIESEESFYRRDHQLIYRAICELDEKSRPFDAVTLGEWFESNDLAEHVAGGAYLIELASTTPSAANVRAYAEIVEDKATLRKLIHAGTQIVNNAFQPEGRDSEQIAADAAMVVEAAITRKNTEGATQTQCLTGLFDEMQRLYADETLPGVVTAYDDLTEALGNFQNGRLYGIGGRPKMGKSIDLIGHACAACRQGKHVALWSIEMGKMETTRRILSAESGVDYKLLERPRMMGEEHWAAVTAAMARIKKWSLTVFDEPGVSVEKIGAQAAILKAQGKLDAAYIDYLQYIEVPTSKKSDTKTNDVGHVSKNLKKIAKRLNVPVVVAFQVNRSSETGSQVRPPRPSDARDSGNIEQDLDVMILIHRPGYYDKKSIHVRYEIALNRAGPTRVLTLRERLNVSKFESEHRDWIDGSNTVNDYGSDPFDH